MVVRSLKIGLFLLVCSTILTGCMSQLVAWHCRNNPENCTIETTDSTVTVSVDTLFYRTIDTLVREDSSWRLRYRQLLDSSFNLKDSIVFDTLGVKTVIYRDRSVTDSTGLRILQMQSDSLLERLKEITIKDSSSTEITKDSTTSVRKTNTVVIPPPPWQVYALIAGALLMVLATFRMVKNT